ncbi:enoyl-CoA hydratase/isomerase family protein [Zavarzinia sp. CC-PAN008]|uniref:enoyl-CoA hydratase/isomerase family protein n=1 Tax=Zavarzinia sp. CC-PAN008 TaxID=3243332 RepID=UPI003F746E2A
MDYQHLVIRKEGPVDHVTLNRPNELNSLNDRLVDELLDYFHNLYFDRSVRIVTIRGAGRAFSAGLDLKQTRSNENPGAVNGSVSDGLKSQRRISEIVMRMRRCPQPIISLVHGPACGGGFAIALASDIRVGGKSLKMNAAFIRIGLSACDIGVSYFLPRLVGVSVASELMLTGRFIYAERALATGLVSCVVDDDKMEQEAQVFIDEMLGTTPIGLRLTKECLNHSVDANSLEQAIAMEDRNQILAAQSADFREGISAFLQKRKPVYNDT